MAQKEEQVSGLKKELLEVHRRVTVAECERTELDGQVGRSRALFDELERNFCPGQPTDSPTA